MKWIPAVSKRTMFIYFTLLFVLYLLYALNSCLVDERKISLKYQFLKQHISNYKSATARFVSFLGLDWDKNNDYRKIQENAVKRLPDALVIGVKKCGTRALLEFLRIHPDVRAAGSEVHFFDKYYHKGFEWYRDKMPATLAGQITMEKTPGYWVTRSAPRRVFAMNPAVKLLAVVRDPVTRAISDYTQSASKRPSLPRFEDLVLVNSTVGWDGVPWSVVDASWPPVRLGVYARPLRRWLRRFPRSRLLLINGERLVTDPAAEMARVQEFLGLKRVITEKHFYFNSTKGFPCLLKSDNRPTPHCLGKTKGRNHPHIDPVAIERLRDFYRPFNERFYQMSGINFGWP
ncbi:heparan sulfate glucosamine 3-O-sulfotransferase 3B1 [Plodia interpunctella]|uniref:heparan sulfate glucosamine 3-O-sulfotransferase 3B1 n=1 Tax=Plodia interpunctella TaxID=58824 RepID=UPI002368C942|nr:heparan sulfate glucosamine 3-O-sulfotransferase 3B1 [Plodia interpunctella]